MLHIKKVLGAKPKEHVVVELKPLATRWGKALDVEHVLEEHPTPQFKRQSFTVLNGIWSCAFANGEHTPTDDLAEVVAHATPPGDDQFDQDIVVPFSPEAPRSGVNRQLEPTELLWYRRTFETPGDLEGKRILLHFQAVDYACCVRVNGAVVGTHVGGYTPFTFDITDFLVGESAGIGTSSNGNGDTDSDKQDNELLVCVADPSEFGAWLRGKQRFDRGDIWYSAQSGIWQTVWMETVPETYLDSIAIEPDARTGILSIGARIANAPSSADGNAETPLQLEVFDAAGTLVASGLEAVEGTAGAIAVHVPDAHLWSPGDPYLYQLVVRCGADEIESYCGFRTVEVKKDDTGHKRVFLNGRPLFIKGVLDQGYWSDGLMTAPADEALVADIEAMRQVGFNLMRKHIKIESARWYYHCDRLGMLVLQDMVSGGAPEINLWHWSYKPTLFKFSWNHYRDDKPSHWEKLGSADAAYQEEWTATCRETVRLLGNSPSIVGWSLFNEGWGQFCAAKADALVRSLDPTRFVDAVSGWYDQRCGDFSSVHNYFRDLAVWRDRRNGRGFFISEFGGFTHRVEGHSSLDEAYGYEPYDDKGEWGKAVRSLLAETEALEEKGLVGYIYTQVSDIEEETNGILTYDREINKLDGGQS